MKEFNVDVTPLIKKLEIFSKKGISGYLAGELRSVFKGRGLEFEGYRTYNPGEDDANQIDWKASLRSRYLLVKQLVEERNNNVMFLIDVSSTMSFASVDRLKNEYVIEMFASLSHALLTGGDSVGVTLFSDRIVKSIQPNIGTKQFYMMMKELTTPENYEGECDFEKVLHDFNTVMVRPAIIILISDFIGMKGEWFEKLKMMSQKHEIITFVVKDPRDMMLPEEVGQVYVQDPVTGQELLINTAEIKQDYERLAQEDNEKLTKLLKKVRSDFLFVNTAEPFTKTLFTFFKRRAAM
ncbi:DUF58 domain-containing protein [Nanoarchaeota archaeon]